MSSKREYEAPDVSKACERMMRALVKRAGTGEAEAVEELVRLQAVLRASLGDAVAEYRQGPAGASWADVAVLVGTTRQAAQITYGRAS